MAAAADPGVLREAVVYLAAATVAVPLFTRAGLGGILGYLAAGVLIGPFALGLVTDPEQTAKFAEFGVVLLLFLIGLELRPARLWQLRRDIFGLGLLQVTLCGLALTAAILALTSLSWQSALVVGLALALSSTALVIGLLQENDLLNTPKGERAFSILLLQDIAIVPLLAIVAAFSRTPDPADAPGGFEQAALTLGGIAALAFVGRYLMNPLFRVLAAARAREVFVTAALLTVIGSAWVMAELGQSMALGAFVAGVMLADSNYRHELEADLEPFRGLLLGLFFIAIGMSLDITAIANNLGLVAALVVAVMAIKAAIVAGLARAFGSPWREARSIGVLLSQGGEFGFVIFTAAAAGLLIAPAAASLFSAVVVISMALTPILMRLVPRTAAAPEDEGGLDGAEVAPRGRAILVGYGRFGQAVGQMLMARGVEVTIIDRNPAQIKVSAPFGVKVYFGDGRRIDVLRAAGAAQAQLILFCKGSDRLEASTIESVRAAFPQARIFGRAYDRRHWIALMRADVDHAVREVFDSGVRMGRDALLALGTPPEAVAEIEEEFRRRDSERLALQYQTGDLLTGREMLFTPGRAMVTDTIGEIPFQPAAPRPVAAGAAARPERVAAQ
jgi:monovalent cation:proton antiporter-2 (CPA2) family protein